MAKYFIDTEFLEGKQSKTFLGFKYGETRPTIDLISIGVVSDDGQEYYTISKDFNLKEAWNRFDLKESSIAKKRMGFDTEKVYWIRDNVLKPIWRELFMECELHNNIYGRKSSIQFENAVNSGEYDQYFTFKSIKSLIQKYGKSNKQISEEVKHFVYWETKDEIGINSGLNLIPKDIKFYGYYSDYDWVVFCWLFGRMIDLPEGFPMYCIDLKQMLDETAVRHINGWLAHKVNVDFDMLTHIKSLPNYPKQTNEHNALDDAKWNRRSIHF